MNGPPIPLPPFPFPLRDLPRLHRPHPSVMMARKYESPVVLTGCMDEWPMYIGLQNAQSNQSKLKIIEEAFEKKLRYMSVPPSDKGAFILDESGAQNFPTVGPEVPFER